MIKYFLISIICTGINTVISALSPGNDSNQTNHSAADKMAKLEARLTYPLIMGSKWCGVIPVDKFNEIPDPNLRYELLFELTYNNPDSLSGEINAGRVEIGRKINLHVASGIPVKNLDIVLEVHGPALYSFLKPEKYLVKYKKDDPKPAFVKELGKVPFRIICCGQVLAFPDLKREDLLPGSSISLRLKR